MLIIAEQNKSSSGVSAIQVNKKEKRTENKEKSEPKKYYMKRRMNKRSTVICCFSRLDSAECVSCVCISV